MYKQIFVLDCESIGLHGEVFAYGYVVVDSSSGNELEKGYAACYGENKWPLPLNRSEVEDQEWVQKNVLPALSGATYTNFQSVREAFWKAWLSWKAQGAVLAADCAWPVEANFLSECIRTDLLDRKWQGPYPLLEISTALLMAGMDPLGEYERLPKERPKHHPTADARQSARLLLQAMQKLKAIP